MVSQMSTQTVCTCRYLSVDVIVQVNETLMRSIVTDPNDDYIFVTNFDAFSGHLNDLVNTACRAVQPTTPWFPTTSPPDLGGSMFQFIPRRLLN